VVDEFLKHKEKFNLFVLSRKVKRLRTWLTDKENKEIADKGANLVVVDYHAVDQLSAALKDASTLISFISIQDKDEFLLVHRNLIKACKESGVKRFVPGEWAGDACK
jgi:hypothetical protein